ncbi:MAG: 50S ribosomal protein L15 [Candidatus Gastranaerophilaceae bacterium]
MERIQLHDLRPAEGSTHKIKRVGRGRSSGHGKTSTRGHNGEGQRSGSSRRPGFEGGQMPAFRRAPKLKGFPIVRPISFAEINVSRLNEVEAKEVNLESLIALGFVHKTTERLRILGNGEIKKALTVKANHFSAAAKEKIEAAGGKVEVV